MDISENIKTYIERGNTNNKFQFFNINNMDTCYDYYKSYTEMLVDQMSPDNNIYNKKNRKEFIFKYLWDESVNAGSIEKYENDFLQINEGTILKIYNFFYMLNTRNNTLGLSLEKCIEININMYYKNKKNNEEIKTKMILSDNKLRNNLAEYMAMFAIKFLTAHEIGHIFNGHTAHYLHVREEIKKLNNNICKDQLYLDLQSMEMDADVFGINRVVDEIVYMINNKDDIFNILKNSEDIFVLLLYAIHGLFYLWRLENGYDNMCNYKYKEHPPMFIREGLIYGAASEHLMHILNNYKLDYTTKLAEIEFKMNIVNEKNNNDYKKFVEKNLLEMKEHGEKISDNWKNRIAYIIKNESRLPIEGIDYN